MVLSTEVAVKQNEKHKHSKTNGYVYLAGHQLGYLASRSNAQRVYIAAC